MFLSEAATAVGEWMRRAGHKLEHPLLYKTGEMAAAGILKCTNCGARIEFDTAAHVPVCSRCRNTEFERD